MAEGNTWRDPKALVLWVMTALVLWLLIPGGARLGILVWEWLNPGVGYVYDPLVVPPFLVHGSIGLAVGAIVVIVVCLKLQLGLLWLLAAVLAAGPIALLLGPLLPDQLGVYAVALLPPVIGALIFKPKPPKD